MIYEGDLLQCFSLICFHIKKYILKQWLEYLSIIKSQHEEFWLNKNLTLALLNRWIHTVQTVNFPTRDTVFFFFLLPHDLLFRCARNVSRTWGETGCRERQAGRARRSTARFQAERWLRVPVVGRSAIHQIMLVLPFTASRITKGCCPYMLSSLMMCRVNCQVVFSF